VIGIQTGTGFGMPQDRLARIAARQAFVDLKHDFMVAVALLPGARGEWLRRIVRNAEDPDALSRVRGFLFAELPGNDADSCSVRHSLQMGLDSLFVDSQPSSQLPR